jgi:hypothetical protein
VVHPASVRAIMARTAPTGRGRDRFDICIQFLGCDVLDADENSIREMGWDRKNSL